MNKKTHKNSQQQKFIEYYSQWYPQEQLISILENSYKCLRIHRANANVEIIEKELQLKNISYQKLSFYPHALQILNSADLAKLDAQDHRYYMMDPASLLPVLALDPQANEKVLDLCAAPGGKALFIADLMHYQGHLVANEITSSRAFRMRQNFKRLQVPEIAQDWQCQITTLSARMLAQNHPEYFDKILLDVPCSMEAHVWNAPQELKKWSPARSFELVRRQRKIFKFAWECLKPGGVMVYATCSISPQENEENMIWLQQKYSGNFNVVEDSLKLDLNNMATAKKMGWLVEPHQHQMGPSYFCKIQKLN